MFYIIKIIFSVLILQFFNAIPYPAKERMTPRRDNTSSMYSTFKPRYGANHKNVGFCFSLLNNVARAFRSTCVLAGKIPLSPYNPTLINNTVVLLFKFSKNRFICTFRNEIYT